MSSRLVGCLSRSGAGRGRGAGCPGAQVPACLQFCIASRRRSGIRGAFADPVAVRRYTYNRWQRLGGHLMVVFKQKRVRDTFNFQVERLPKGTACDHPRAFQRDAADGRQQGLLPRRGHEWIGWRCVTSPQRRSLTYVLSATFTRPAAGRRDRLSDRVGQAPRADARTARRYCARASRPLRAEPDGLAPASATRRSPRTALPSG